VVLLILRCSSLGSELGLSQAYAHVMEIASPRLYARMVQSFVQLQDGAVPLENLFLTDGQQVLPAGKLLFVVTDPFHIDLNSKRNLARLYDRIAALLALLAQQVHTETAWCAELDMEGFCKLANLRIACDDSQELSVRMMHLMDALCEFAQGTLLVLCNVRAYFTDAALQELFKYALYTKTPLLLLEPALGRPLLPREKRWTVGQDFDDFLSTLCTVHGEYPWTI
jgi:hypothetical protein